MPLWFRSGGFTPPFSGRPSRRLWRGKLAATFPRLVIRPFVGSGFSRGHQTPVLWSVASPTPHAAHDRPCTRVRKRPFRDCSAAQEGQICPTPGYLLVDFFQRLLLFPSHAQSPSSASSPVALHPLPPLHPIPQHSKTGSPRADTCAAIFSQFQDACLRQPARCLLADIAGPGQWPLRCTGVRRRIRAAESARLRREKLSCSGRLGLCGRDTISMLPDARHL